MATSPVAFKLKKNKHLSVSCSQWYHKSDYIFHWIITYMIEHFKSILPLSQFFSLSGLLLCRLEINQECANITLKHAP